MRTTGWTREGSSSALPPARVTAFPLWQRLVRSRASTRAWEMPVLLCLLALSALLYLWDLGREGMANTFYSAAVMSGSQSWKAFFFGSFDAASFVTVAKPPLALGERELSARLLFRYTQPDGILTLLLVGSAYTTLRAVESGRIRWLVATGVLLGFAFNTQKRPAFP